MSADDLVWVKLNDGNVGDHPITFQRTDYGYRSHGDRFMMSRKHAELDQRVIIEDLPAVAEPEPETPKELAAPSLLDDSEFVDWTEEVARPTSLVEDLAEAFAPASDLDGLWGMNPERKAKLVEAGIVTRKQLIATDPEVLGEIIGLAPMTVGRLVASAQKK